MGKPKSGGWRRFCSVCGRVHDATAKKQVPEFRKCPECKQKEMDKRIKAFNDKAKACKQCGSLLEFNIHNPANQKFCTLKCGKKYHSKRRYNTMKRRKAESRRESD